MPTNPNWLEHTERAAWDTVQSLRQEIEQERKRSARLAPAGESWRKILDELDNVKAEQNLEAERYVDIVSLLRKQLVQLKAERDSLLDQLQSRKLSAGGSAQLVEVIHHAPRPDDGQAAISRRDSCTWFAQRIAQLRDEQERQGRSLRTASYDNCLTALELKLEELEEAPRRDTTALAIELGALALRVAEFERPVPALEEDDL